MPFMVNGCFKDVVKSIEEEDVAVLPFQGSITFPWGLWFAKGCSKRTNWQMSDSYFVLWDPLP